MRPQNPRMLPLLFSQSSLPFATRRFTRDTGSSNSMKCSVTSMNTIWMQGRQTLVAFDEFRSCNLGQVGKPALGWRSLFVVAAQVAILAGWRCLSVYFRFRGRSPFLETPPFPHHH